MLQNISFILRHITVRGGKQRGVISSAVFCVKFLNISPLFLCVMPLQVTAWKFLTCMKISQFLSVNIGQICLKVWKVLDTKSTLHVCLYVVCVFRVICYNRLQYIIIYYKILGYIRKLQMCCPIFCYNIGRQWLRHRRPHCYACMFFVGFT